jgi:hypothetical protein
MRGRGAVASQMNNDMRETTLSEKKTPAMGKSVENT